MDTTADRTNDVDLAWLFVAFFAAPLAWAFTEGAGYAAVKPVCAGGNPAMLALIALAGLLASGAGAWFGWRRLSALRGVATDEGGRDIDRSYFIALVAAGLNVLVALLIVTTLGSQLLSQCE